MRVGLYAPDSTIPNLALMKLSAYHKLKHDMVSWYSPTDTYDKVYISKIFTFTKLDFNEQPFIKGVEYGGSGYSLNTELPLVIDDISPDYSIYPKFKQALGFTTRGCIRKCWFCSVYEKEGMIKPYRSIEQIVGDRKEVLLLDNNILAHEHGIKQIERLTEMQVKVDFNQGLDFRLIDKAVARLLAKINWLVPLRIACDSIDYIGKVVEVISLLRWYNVTPSRYCVYVLAVDFLSTWKLICILKGLFIDPYVQIYKDRDNTEPEKTVKELGMWVNQKRMFRSMSFYSFLKVRNSLKYFEKHIGTIKAWS